MIRSLLFLPGNNPAMLMNGDILGADAIILDLEDAVSPDEKDAARILVRNAISTLGYPGVIKIVRINSIADDGHWLRDIEAVVPLGIDAVMPTKVRDASYIAEIAVAMRAAEAHAGNELGCTKIVPLLETAQGIENAFSIARSEPRVSALYLGAEDLTADLRCQRTKEGNEIFWARSRLLCAARAAGIAAFDTPFTDVDDLDGLEKDARVAKALGYSGKAVISPRHVGIVNAMFSPTAAEIDYALEVVAAIEEGKAKGRGAVSLRGKMIDAPIVLRARQVLEAGQAMKGGVRQ